MFLSSSDEGRELAATTEGVAGEVGELEEQFAGAHRVGADEARDGRQGVVDEVRADLRPQGPEFRLGGAGRLERSSSASSTCVDTQRATSSVARTVPAEVSVPKASRAPTTRSSPVIGATTADRIGHSSRSRRPRRSARGRRCGRCAAPRRRARGRPGRDGRPQPSQTSVVVASTMRDGRGPEQRPQVPRRPGRAGLGEALRAGGGRRGTPCAGSRRSPGPPGCRGRAAAGRRGRRGRRRPPPRA